MLIGRDLGFSWLALVIVLFVTVIGFVVRRKWRLSLARAEEIQRLLIFASEESARAELEATVGYSTSGVSDSEQLKYQWATTSGVSDSEQLKYQWASQGYSSAGASDSEQFKYQRAATGYSDGVGSTSSQQLQYQCAVCFCPTTRRCARCKSVRYCSGECQIIHWRQGHKDNCHPFTTTNQINDVGNLSCQEAFKQEGDDNISNTFESEEKQAKPVKMFTEESAFASSGPPNIVDSRDDDGGRNSTVDVTSRSFYKESSASGACNESSVDASVSTTHGSNYVYTNQNKDGSDHLSNLNRIKLGGSDRESQSSSSSSSGWSVDGSNDSTFSEPSTPSSGFWDGTLDSTLDSGEVILPRMDLHSSNGKRSSLDDGPNSMEIKKLADEAVSLEELSSSGLKYKKPLPPGSVKSSPVRSNGKKFSLDDVGLTTSEIKKPTDEAGSSEASNSSGLKYRKTSSPGPVKSSPVRSNGNKSSLYDAGLTTSEIKKPVDGAGSSEALSTSNLKYRKSPSHSVKSSLVKLNHLVDDTRLSKSRDVESLSSKPLENEDSCFSEFVGKSKIAKKGLKTSMLKVVDQLRASKPSQLGNTVSTRYIYKGLFPYEMFVYLYNWKEVDLHPRGLINCGNSCYANAVLQSLAFTPPLSAYLLQRLHSKTCETNDWCFTCEFESLVLRMKDGNSPLSPVRILSRIQNIGSNLSNGREEDAHEFLRYAIDTMKSVCLKESGTNASCSSEEETTLIDLTFGGYLRSKIRCMRCGGKSERNERMMDLTVEIDGDVRSLEEALRKFTGTEILDGENKYQCSRCKSYEKAKKKLTVLEAPNVLTIALKRFQSGKFGKLNKSIQFPEILDLAPYMSETSDTSPIYRLYGVVVHLDIMNAAFSGHYVCYVKNIQNKWFNIDDSTVRPVELERVLLSKGAYMLLYARCSPHAPRSIRNSIIPRPPKEPTSKSRSHRTGDFYTENPSFRPIIDEDSSSEISSSLFSESGSFSTKTSTRDSTSTTDDYFDQIFGEFGRILSGQSDSDTSSSSSYPSPLYEYKESNVEDSVPFSYSDRLGSSSYRVTESDRLGLFYPSDANSGVSYRRSSSTSRD